MFTGIITHTGTLKKRTTGTIEIGAPLTVLKKLKIGDSIAVSGVCLTVTKKTKKSFSSDVMVETWQKTMLGSLKIDALINLELPLRAGEFLSGHIVQGHVDGTAKIVSIKKIGNSHIFTFKKMVADPIFTKGSVTINGISLTVIKTTGQNFSIGIIPHTWNTTSLREAKVGDLVNVEVDHNLRPTGKIAIIASSFHKNIVELMKSNCINTLTKNNIALKDIHVVDVPGALEIPLTAKKLAKKNIYSAIIALGVVHKGKTYHFEQVSNECVRGCMQVAYDYEIPVIYEVLSVYNLKDAMERAKGKTYNRGKDAAETALKMIKLNNI